MLPAKHPVNRARNSGMSLPELMIAMALGLIIVGGMATLFVESRRNFSQDEIIATMQQEGRFAMNELQREVSMAGFWGPMLAGTLLGNDATLAGVAFTEYESPILALDNAAGAQAFDWSVNLDDLVPTSDAISIRRVEGVRTSDTTADTLAELGIAAAEDALDANAYYLQTNGTVGVMLPGSAAPNSAVPTPYEYWEYAATIWYVRSYCRAGDNIPSLVRRYWDSDTASVETDCMAQGIENMQVEFGLDDDDDGFPEQWVTNVDTANSEELAAVRIFLLSRGTQLTQGYTNGKSYDISNLPTYTPADGYFRRVFTTTIQTRNPIAARLITN